VRTVDVSRSDILDQLSGCDGFMWRHGHLPYHRQIARRLLPVIERELGLAVYPDQKTCWHYDDKISQYYLFTAAGIPMPETWVWFDYEQAMQWADAARFPLVLKLWSGSASENVCMVKDRAEAMKWIGRLFIQGVANMNEFSDPPLKAFVRRLRHSARVLLKGRFRNRPWELHRNYILAQEFVEDNDFDTRVVVIGNRAFAKRRYNRPGDFRASGTANVDCDPTGIDLRAVRLAFQAAQRLGAQSLAFDILRRREEHLVTEVSYTYPSKAQHDCPGHWEMTDGGLVWAEGHMWPEEAQIQDFLARIEQRRQWPSRVCV
jgi:glutathione synthase/RimK-type ligase-like ATP-grasp enzyme